MFFSIVNIFIINSLKELGEFIKVTDKGLTKPVDEGDYDGLVECMEHLSAVKDRQANTDEMFEPLKQTIELLKTYEQEMPEEVHMQLQVSLIYCTVVLEDQLINEVARIPFNSVVKPIEMCKFLLYVQFTLIRIIQKLDFITIKTKFTQYIYTPFTFQHGGLAVILC